MLARQAGGVLVLVVQAVAVEAPDLAAPERAADVAVQVVLLLDLVAALERHAREEAVVVTLIGRLEEAGDVVGDHVLVLVVAVPVAGEPIAARLDADAEHRAAAEGRGVGAGAADLELFEAAVVEVAGVGVGGFGGVDALETGLVLVVHAVAADRWSGCRCATRRRRSAVICMPGAAAMAAHTSRALGISVSSSLVKLVPIVVVEVSTTGEAAGDRDASPAAWRPAAAGRPSASG